MNYTKPNQRKEEIQMKKYCTCQNCPCDSKGCGCFGGKHLYRIISSDYERMIKNDLLVRNGMAQLRDIEDA